MSKAIQLQDVSVRYEEKVALKSVNLTVEVGDYVGIIGPNGGGKTTLLKAILGVVPIASGHIDIMGHMPGDTGKIIGYVPQISDLNKRFPVTVKEVVLMGMLDGKVRPFHRYSKADYTNAEVCLERVGILNLKDRLIANLSGGEFQKVLIARALAVEPKILLMDEPTASVDSGAREHIFTLLNELNKTMTIVLVTHDMMAVSVHVKSLACINGALVYHGGKEIGEEVMDALYGCPIDLIAHGVPHRVLKRHGEEN